jgi:hypothetical protein
MTIEERLGGMEARIAQLERELRTERAEREALQKLVVPEVVETRKDLELNINYLTERLEAFHARPAGEPDDDLVEDVEHVIEGLVRLAKLYGELDDRVRWLTGVVTRDLERQARLLSIEVEPTGRGIPPENSQPPG